MLEFVKGIGATDIFAWHVAGLLLIGLIGAPLIIFRDDIDWPYTIYISVIVTIFLIALPIPTILFGMIYLTIRVLEEK